MAVQKKYLVFDIWSQYAHFKKPYTTTSPLTFSVPPRTTVAGILAAIAGIDKKEYLDFFGKKAADIAVGIKEPIKKVRIAENLINTKDSLTRIMSRTQIKIEFLKNPKYRIYFSHSDDELHTRIKAMLQNHASYYSISLGLSENLANYEFIGEYGTSRITKTDHVAISSIVPLDAIQKNKLLIVDDAEYFTENIPVEMARNRKTVQFREVLFERNARKIKVSLSDFIGIDELNENIIIL